MVNSIEELIKLIQKRDDITYDEAELAVRTCAEELDELLASEVMDIYGYEQACEIIQYNLGLEPDYLDLFLV